MSEPTCKFCGTVPNSGEVLCASEKDAQQCPWMGESDWKRYQDAVDKARAWDALINGVTAERDRCAKIAEEFGEQGRDGFQIAKAIRDSPQENADV